MSTNIAMCRSCNKGVELDSTAFSEIMSIVDLNRQLTERTTLSTLDSVLKCCRKPDYTWLLGVEDISSKILDLIKEVK